MYAISQEACGSCWHQSLHPMAKVDRGFQQTGSSNKAPWVLDLG